MLFDEGPAGDGVWVSWRFDGIENRRHAGIEAVECRLPIVPAAGRKVPDQGRSLGRPHLLFVLVGGAEHGVVECDAEAAEQRHVEGGLDSADGDPLVVRSRVDVVERGAGVDEVGAAWTPPAAGPARVERRHQEGRTIDHRSVDHLPATDPPGAPGGTAGMKGGENSHGEEHPAAGEVAKHVDRRCRRLPGPPEGFEGPGQGDVVDVVSRTGGHRTNLTPPCQAAVDQARVAGQARHRSDAEALGDTRPEHLDEGVRTLDKTEDGLDRTVGLEVESDRKFATVHRVTGRLGGIGRRDVCEAVDPQNLRPQIGEQHPAEWPRAEPDQFDDPDPSQRPQGPTPPLLWSEDASPSVWQSVRKPSLRVSRSYASPSPPDLASGVHVRLLACSDALEVAGRRDACGDPDGGSLLRGLATTVQLGCVEHRRPFRRYALAS